jgi:hypothetical protein
MYKPKGVKNGVNPRAEFALDTKFQYTRKNIATWSSQVYIDSKSKDAFSFVQIFNLERGSSKRATSMMLHAQPKYISIYSSASKALTYDFRDQWIDVNIVHDARKGKITTTVKNAKGQSKSINQDDEKAANKWVFKWGPYSKIEKTKECRPQTVKFRNTNLTIQ